MRRLVVSLLSAVLLLAVAGCGDDNNKDTATDPQTPTSSSVSDSSSPAQPSPSPTKGDGEGSPVDYQLVTLITETDAGGAVNPTAVPLTDAAAVAAYGAQFSHSAMATDIATVAGQTTVQDGQVLYAAIVSVGCTPPTDVVVTQVPNGLEIAPKKVDSPPQQECFAAMTTVALVIGPDVVNGR